jgi:polyisoprenoid-binding protein YceI
MFKPVLLSAIAAIVTFAGPSTTAPISGSWNIDTRHSDVQLITDGTTDYGKTKINYTAGYTRINGTVKLDTADLANSKFDLHMYPANAMAPPIAEEGKNKNRWMEDMATHTMICFHSKNVTQSSDGKLQVTGDLVLTRVDRNVEIEPTEAYSGPTYGPPIVHRVVREATLVFDAPAAAGSKNGELKMSGSTTVGRENFPQLVKAVLSTYWPPVVQDAKCQNTAAPGGEDYRGFQCSGTFMQTTGLPPAPVQIGEDYPGASNFNAVVGNQITIQLHLHLTQNSPGA